MSLSFSRSGIAALILLSLIWGYTWVAMKEAARFADPFDFSALRTIAGASHLRTRYTEPTLKAAPSAQEMTAR
jgi:hypothetical protein